ncbi:T9SS type A sorting domain-containing protein [candidate division KSB1 bacterium]|nr:T9SS type A sorting domain-containing protein [candidate division KSB1 bacterium]
MGGGVNIFACPNRRDTESKEQSKLFQSSIPKQFNLLPGYPNPFSNSTTLTVELPKAELVTFSIYNVHGQKILQTNQHFESAGRYEINWDGKDFNRQWVSSGIYIAVMRSANEIKSIKLIKL